MEVPTVCVLVSQFMRELYRNSNSRHNLGLLSPSPPRQRADESRRPLLAVRPMCQQMLQLDLAICAWGAQLAEVLLVVANAERERSTLLLRG